MGKSERLKLHSSLIEICPDVYFQPPSSVTLAYPCIVYNRTGIDKDNANNKTYIMSSVYSIVVMDRDPDSEIPEDILNRFTMSSVGTTYVSDNIHHTPITLYY